MPNLEKQLQDLEEQKRQLELKEQGLQDERKQAEQELKGYQEKGEQTRIQLEELAQTIDNLENQNLCYLLESIRREELSVEYLRDQLNENSLAYFDHYDDDNDNVSLFYAAQLADPSAFNFLVFKIANEIITANSQKDKLIDLINKSITYQDDSDVQHTQTPAHVAFANSEDDKKVNILKTLNDVITDDEDGLFDAVYNTPGGNLDRTLFHEALVQDYVKPMHALLEELNPERSFNLLAQQDAHHITVAQEIFNLYYNGQAKEEFINTVMDKLRQLNRSDQVVSEELAASLASFLAKKDDSNQRNLLQQMITLPRVNTQHIQNLVELYKHYAPEALADQDYQGRNALFLAIDHLKDEVANSIMQLSQDSNIKLDGLLQVDFSERPSEQQKLTNALIYLSDDYCQQLVNNIAVNELAKSCLQQAYHEHSVSIGNALHIVVREGKWQTAKSIVDKALGANDPNLLVAQDAERFNPLHLAFIESGSDDEPFRDFITAYSKAPNLTAVLDNNIEGFSVLRTALQNGYYDKAGELLEALAHKSNIKEFANKDEQLIKLDDETKLNLLDFCYFLDQQQTQSNDEESDLQDDEAQESEIDQALNTDQSDKESISYVADYPARILSKNEVNLQYFDSSQQQVEEWLKSIQQMQNEQAHSAVSTPDVRSSSRTSSNSNASAVSDGQFAAFFNGDYSPGFSNDNLQRANSSSSNEEEEEDDDLNNQPRRTSSSSSNEEEEDGHLNNQPNSNKPY